MEECVGTNTLSWLSSNTITLWQLCDPVYTLASEAFIGQNRDYKAITRLSCKLAEDHGVLPVMTHFPLLPSQCYHFKAAENCAVNYPTPRLSFKEFENIKRTRK